MLAAQSVQVIAPSLLHFPAGHGEHDMALPRLNVPARHGVHAAPPLVTWFPGLQVMHEVAPMSDAYSPEAHGKQNSLSFILLK